MVGTVTSIMKCNWVKQIIFFISYDYSDLLENQEHDDL